MSLWDRFCSWFGSHAEQLLVVPFPESKGPKMQADEAYFGLWLAHVFLAKEGSLLEKSYPAAHVSVRFDVAGETRTVTRVAGPPDDLVGPGVWTDYPVTGLAPYRGGTVELEAGLTPLRRGTYLSAAIGVLGDFSSLVAPPLSQAIEIAGKVSDGVEKLLEEAGGDVRLGLHRGFAPPQGGGKSVLAPGHLAIVGASEGDLDPGSLSVQGSRLHGADGPLEGYDYMLFRLECVREREDWHFAAIERLIRKAIQAHINGEERAFEGFRDAVLAEILVSADLTRPDRNRVARAVLDQIEEAISYGQGAIGGEPPSLAAIVERHAVSLDDPRALNDITLSQLLARE